MKSLTVDMTPTCINRTAIYHIAYDTVRGLADFDLHFKYLDTVAADLCTPDEEKVIKGRFERTLAEWARSNAHVDEIGLSRPIRRGPFPTLYFDPIYILDDALTSTDTVFVLDLTTLTDRPWHSSTVCKAYERAFRKLAASQAKLIAISEHCASALEANFPIDRSSIAVIPLYHRGTLTEIDPLPIPKLAGRRFFLFVGSLEARKNVAGLINAFGLSDLGSDGWELVIAGGKAHGHEEILQAADRIDGVHLLGFVPDAQLAWLYRNAGAFLYPSYLEGFGVPLLEAMSFGLPCLTSITGAPREICGEYGILVDPYDAASILDGMKKLARRLTSLDEEDRHLIRERAARFDFETYMTKIRRVLAS